MKEGLKYDLWFCDCAIPSNRDMYIYLNNFEKIFCCDDYMIEWLFANDIAEWDMNFGED